MFLGSNYRIDGIVHPEPRRTDSVRNFTAGHSKSRVLEARQLGVPARHLAQRWTSSLLAKLKENSTMLYDERWNRPAIYEKSN